MGDPAMRNFSGVLFEDVYRDAHSLIPVLNGLAKAIDENIYGPDSILHVVVEHDGAMDGGWAMHVYYIPFDRKTK